MIEFRRLDQKGKASLHTKARSVALANTNAHLASESG